MGIELSLLKLFCDDREVEAIHHGYLDSLDNLERELKLLYSLVHRYYLEFEKAKSISKPELLHYYDLKYPKARDRTLHLELIDQAYASNISIDLMKAHLDQLIEKHHATAIINKLLPVMEGDKFGILDTINEDVTTFTDLLHNPPERLIVPEPCIKSLEELVKQEIEYKGIPWHLPELTDIMGGARKKQLGLIYAYVGTGKTSFTMAAVASFARYLMDTEDTIVYCGNEESDDRLVLRLVTALTGFSSKQLEKNWPEAQKVAEENGVNSIKVFGNITTGEQLEYIIKKYTPHILVMDQAPYVQIPAKKKEEGVKYLETLFQYYRRLCDIHNFAFIGVAQAEGKAEDTKYLKLGEIYGARVAIQGALDWAIGIGKKEKDVDEEMRYINVAKNKGDENRFAAMFNKYTNEWKGV